MTRLSWSSNGRRLMAILVCWMTVAASLAFTPTTIQTISSSIAVKRHRSGNARFPARNVISQSKPSLHISTSTPQVPTRSTRTRTTIVSNTRLQSESAGSLEPLDDVTLSTTRSPPPALLSAALLFVLDILFRRLFAILNLTSFPSSLAGCGVLFASLLASKTDGFLTLLQPGAALLAKWLPVFFVPSLITLPLSSGFGSLEELAKVGLVVGGGFFFTLLTTSYSVLMVRQVAAMTSKSSQKNAFAAPALEEVGTTATQSANSDSTNTATDNDNDQNDADSIATPLSPKDAAAPVVTKGPFSNSLFYTLSSLSAATAVASIASHWVGGSGFLYVDSLITTSLLLTTLASFVYGTRLPKKFTKIAHPLVTCSAITWTVLGALGLATSRSFKSMLRTYRTGRILNGPTGAGDLLLFCLGPAVVSLAISMYEKRKLMRDNLTEVGTAIGVSTLGGLFGTAAIVRLLEIGDPTIRLALLSRNITSPLAMAIAGILGADVSLAVSMVVITGLLGANFGASILSALGIKDAVARGLGIGAAAHGLGTAAIVDEKDAFPFAAIAMALTGFAATVTVSIPLFRRIILEFALGY